MSEMEHSISIMEHLMSVASRACAAHISVDVRTLNDLVHDPAQLKICHLHQERHCPQTSIKSSSNMVQITA